MRTLAKLNREAPFAILTHSLVVQDVELKAAIMVFVNSMIMGIDDINAHALLRSDLNSQLFEESYDKAAAQVTREEKLLRRMSEASDVESKSIRRKTLVSMHGSKAYSQQQIEQLLKTGEAQDVDPAFLLVKSKGQTVRVNPRQGSMAGLLIAAKNAEKLESAFVDLLGGKKTKRRWYELDDNYFKWCAGHDRENEFKEFIPINSIIDVRPYSTDVYIKELGAPAFEMETTERVYAFGCESAADKDHWITALQVSRENHYLRNGEYKIVAKELQPADVFKFAEQFRKQGEVYHQISVEHKRMALTACGLDLTDICKVFDYLRLETIAIGVNSHLLKILQELLLIPAGSETLWAALSSAIQQLREQSGRSSEVVHKTLNKKSIVELFDNKGEGGQTYTQMSKLAMLAVNSETQIKELTQRLHNSEKEAERMREKIVQLKNANANFTRENGDVVEKSELVAKHIPKFQNNDATASPALPTIPPPPLPQAPPPSAVVAPSSANPLMQNIRFAKYEKMKKMLPEGAVRQKMQVDGLTEDEIENFMSGTIAAAPAPEAPANIPDSRFEKYEKMKKMLPEGAVRQKMQTDGFSENEIEAFMNGVTVAPLATVTAAPVDPRLEKYVKMKKMLPEGAVRQKMQVDGFSESEIESFMTGTTPTAPATAAPAVDPRFEKYEKMKKMLPEGAVRQKMQTDGFSADEIESFMSGKPMIAVAAASSGPSADDLRFAKYEKMKKMLPEGAVRQKMVADGFTESDINKFFNASGAVAAFSKPVAKAPAVELPPEGMQAKKAVKPLGKMKGFFWVKLKSSEVPGTIWHKMNEFEIPENDKKELIEWFGTVTKVEQPASRSNSPVKDRKPQLISLLDGKRTQNWLIFMGKVRMGPEDLIKLVIDVSHFRFCFTL